MDSQTETNISQIGEKTEEMLGTTTKFELVTGAIDAPPIIPSTLPEIQNIQQHQDILDFLSKPIYLQTVSFPATANRGDLLYSLVIASTVLSGGYTAWLNKLAGFYSFYGTFVVDIVINATPFHSGAILCNYFPAKSVLPNAFKMHAKDLNGQSQLPGSVVANINQNHYTFKVPYVSAAEMFVLNGVDTEFPDWGDLMIWVWSPLKVGTSGANAISLSVWGHWEDVILGPVYPQSSRSRRSKVRFATVNPETEEAKVAPDGPLASALNTVSIAADTLADIPVIGPIAGAVGWATGIASGIANFFGFSKPLSQPGITRHFSQIGQYAHNGSGCSDAMILSTQHDAKTRLIEEKTIYEYDEMSLAFIKSRPAYIKNINYTTSSTAGSQIDAFTLTLADFYTNVTYDLVSLRQYTPVGFLASHFFQYTGGVKIKIKFFKTAFHAGVLSFAFVPEVTSATSYTFNQLVTVNRYVIDIQTEDELIIEIPYQRAYPNEYTHEPLGTLYCHAVIPLRAPETVANNIDITYEVLGADDLTFYNPQTDVPIPVICQGATEEVGTSQESLIGGSNTINDVIQISQDAVGEQINSIKQLINRHSAVHSLLNFVGGNTFWFNSSAISTIGWNATTHASTIPLIYGSTVDLFAFCYAFRRGSNRWRFTRNQPSTVPFLFKEAHSTPSNIQAAYSTNAYDSIQKSSTYEFVPIASNRIAFVSQEHGSAEVQAPFQHIGVVSPNEPYQTGAANRNQPTLAIVVRNNNAADDLNILRAAGDDYQFKFWIGVPLTSELNFLAPP